MWLYWATGKEKPVVAQHLFPTCEIFRITFSDKHIGKPKSQRPVNQEREDLKKNPSG